MMVTSLVTVSYSHTAECIRAVDPKSVTFHLFVLHLVQFVWVARDTL